METSLKGIMSFPKLQNSNRKLCFKIQLIFECGIAFLVRYVKKEIFFAKIIWYLKNHVLLAAEPFFMMN